MLFNTERTASVQEIRDPEEVRLTLVLDDSSVLQHQLREDAAHSVKAEHSVSLCLFHSLVHSSIYSKYSNKPECESHLMQPLETSKGHGKLEHGSKDNW